MKKHKLLWLTVSGVAVAVFALGYWTLPLHAAESTQTFVPNNFSMLAADINVWMLQQNSQNNSSTQKCLFKMDNRTGQLWVLQLSVNSNNDPTVVNAVWAPVQSGGQYVPGGNGSAAGPNF